MTLKQKQEFDALLAQMQVLDNRAEVICKLSQARTIKELRKLCPELPNTGEALHLAHNWLVCRRSDKPEGRRAAYLINKHGAIASKTYKLKSSFWLRKSSEIISK